MKNLILNFLNDIKRNYKTLILAFIIACALWVVVSVLVFNTIEDRIKGISIEAQTTEYMVQNNLQITTDIEDSVNIRIQGKRYDISDLNAADFFASVNLSSVRAAGTYTLPLTVSPKTDRSCTILDFEPQAITLVVDEIITKEFPVVGTAPDISLPEGYYADDITVSPATISLQGSASVINKVSKIEARSTYHGDTSESLQTGSEIYIYGANGSRIDAENIQLSTDNISVNIPIFKQKELPLKFSVIKYPNNFDIDSLKYEIHPTTLTVAAPDDSIDNLSELNIGTIDISDIRPGQNITIPIALPEGYKNLSGNKTAMIEWKLNNYGNLTYPINSSDIIITNGPDNFDVSLITSEFQLTVIGPSESLAEISSGDISVTVDLLGVTLRNGAQDVPISVQIKGSKQKCWVSGSYKVTVNASPKQDEDTE